MSLNRRTFMLLLLAVSVTLNLFFIGALTARYVDRPQRSSEPLSMRWVMRALNESDREVLRPRLSQYNEVLRPLRWDMFQTQQHINDLLVATEVDTDAVTEAFGQLRSVNLQYQQLTHQHLAEVFATLTPAQRERVIQFMEERRNADIDRNRSEAPRTTN
jgi:uncharacterized membrane protein